MSRSKAATGLAALLLLCGGQNAAAVGLATRDQNPMLQPVYLPGYFSVAADRKWRLDTNLYITNTHQLKEGSSEDLIIDVENMRLQFDIGLRRGDWVYTASVPFIDNRAGEFDRIIEDWHDFWGFPQGTRDQTPRFEIDIEYRRDGELVYSQTSPSNGLADIALALGYQPADEIGYFVGIELPSGDSDDFSGNDSVDLALWLAGQREVNPVTDIYGLFGVTFPGDDGNLGSLLVDQIWFAQLGVEYRFTDRIVGIAQLDLHGKTISDSDLRAFGESLQLQLALGAEDLIAGHRLDLFFSEDIAVGTAPDITAGARLTRQF